MEEENKKFYVIEISVECSDKYEELIWSEGLVSFLSVDKNEKRSLKNISDEMWKKFNENRSKAWNQNRNRQTTIGIFENNEMGILYSDANEKTINDEIEEIIDTINVDINDFFGEGYDIFKDEVGISE